MSKRLTVTLSDTDYAVIVREANKSGQSVSMIGSELLFAAVEAITHEADAQAALDEWALRMIPPAGNA